MSQSFHPTIALADLAPNSSHETTIDGISILICHCDGEIFAVENRCPHQASPLAGGRVRRGTIACPLHGMRFELRSGKPMGQLTQTPLRTFVARAVDGVIEVAID
jgi:3-phenylpropionate/trans-cinnamate dioxygenase ferredoxin component